MPVPSPDDDQFVEPSNATMPSRTPPLVWLIWLVDDSPTAKSLAQPCASCATSEPRIAFSCAPLACDLSSVTWTMTDGCRNFRAIVNRAREHSPPGSTYADLAHS